MSLKTFIALLRGINVTGRNKVPMEKLRSLCAGLGWKEVQTYIQSGNVVFQANGAAAKLEAAIEAAIERELGLSIATLVRAAVDWPAYVRGNPFPEASEKEPNLVMLALSKSPPRADAVEKLQERAECGERIVQVGDALWLHFGGGVGRSKLSPAVLDRSAGSPVTMRNWRTVLKVQEMASGGSSSHS
jgi:uncharacterized protein (DUF1697 family)